MVLGWRAESYLEKLGLQYPELGNHRLATSGESPAYRYNYIATNHSRSIKFY